MPRDNSATVFFFAVSRADLKPRSAARWKRVGHRKYVALSMYSASPLVSSKKELPVIPCSSGQTPQAMEALFTFVTDGMTPRTVLEKPFAMSPLRTGMGLSSR